MDDMEIASSGSRAFIQVVPTLCAVALLLGSCGGSDSGPSPTSPTSTPVRSLTVVLVAIDDYSYQAKAVAAFSDGSSREVTSEVQWRSSNPAVALIAADGRVTVTASGTTEIQGTYRSVGGAAHLSVARPPPVPVSEFLVTGTLREALEGETLTWGEVERVQEGNSAGDKVTYRLNQAREFNFFAIAGKPLAITTVVAGFESQTRELMISGPTRVDFSLVPLPVTVHFQAIDAFTEARPVRCYPVRVEFIEGPNAGRVAVMTSGTDFHVANVRLGNATIRVSAPAYQAQVRTVKFRPDPDYPFPNASVGFKLKCLSCTSYYTPITCNP